MPATLENVKMKLVLPPPAGASTRVGAGGGRMVTAWLHVLVFPHASVAIHVAVITCG